MQISEITQYLHHRVPYLMLDEVLELSSKKVVAVKTHHLTEAHIQGHFPGAHIVPGAMLQEMCTQAAGLLITKYYSPTPNYNSQTTKGWALGVLKKVDFAKYISLVKPEKVVKVEVELIENIENLFHFKARVLQDGVIKAKLGFNLINISDQHLFA